MMTRKEFLQTVGGAALVAASPQVSAAAVPAPAKSGLRRGVSLYSYQEEYYTRAMTLEDCLSEAASIGAYEIEMLPEQMVPGFPTPSAAWVDQWHGLLQKYRLTAACYTQFQDTFLTRQHDLTVDEGVAMLERDLKLAKRLRFKTMRLLIGTPLDVIERSLPLAAKYDVWMGCEIHAPCTLDGKLVARWLQIIEKSGTKHFGLIPDFGIFVARPGRVQRDRMVRDGRVTGAVAAYVESAWESKTPKADVAAEVARRSSKPGDRSYVNMVYNTKMEDPNLLIPMKPYIRHFHAKFYEMTEDLHEYQIPYEQVVPVLVKGGIDASFCSEYEGQRHTQDAFETDSCEQVRRQHVMLRRLLGEI